MPHHLAASPGLNEYYLYGPNSSSGVAKFFRARVRELKKAKQDYEYELLALYGAAAMGSLFTALKFCDVQGAYGHQVAAYVAISDLADIKVDYRQLGYHAMTDLGKTDVKWLIECFGEPAEHQSLAEPYSNVVRKAVARYCWSELANQNGPRKSLGMPELTLAEWLREQVKMYLGYAKEGQARIVKVQEQQKAFGANFKVMMKALNGDFAIVDIETTGLDAGSDEIIEIGALLVGPGFVAAGEFSTLVKATRPVPRNITQLTGIEQTLLNREGASLRDAVERLQAFVGNLPVFAHNSPFAQGFLAFAATQCGTSFSNIMHDSVSLSRWAFPELDSYKLINVAKHVGAEALPNHRAIGDAKATLAILRAASKELEV